MNGIRVWSELSVSSACGCTFVVQVGRIWLPQLADAELDLDNQSRLVVGRLGLPSGPGVLYMVVSKHVHGRKRKECDG